MTKQINNHQTTLPIQQDTVGNVGDPHGNTGDSTADFGLSGAPSTCIVAVNSDSKTDDGRASHLSDENDPSVANSNGDAATAAAIALVSPRPPPPIDRRTFLDFEQQVKDLNKAVVSANKKLKLKQKKVNQLLKTVSQRNDDFTKMEVKLNARLASKDVQISNWKNRLERAKETKTAIREGCIAECTATIERQKAKATAAMEQLSVLRKQHKKANRNLEVLESQLESKMQRLAVLESANTKLSEDNHHLKTECRDLRKTVYELRKDLDKLKDELSNNQIQRDTLALERLKIEADIAKTNQQKRVLEEQAKQERQLVLADHVARLKDEAAAKRKRDKHQEAIDKQNENAKRLKRSVMMNVGGFHHSINHNNPANGRFLNARQLGSVDVDQYDASMSIMSGDDGYSMTPEAYQPVEAEEDRPMVQLTMTQCDRRSRLVPCPPPRPKKIPLPNPRDLPEGVQAIREPGSGIIYYRSVDEDLQIKRPSKNKLPSPLVRDAVQNVPMSQLSEMTETQRNEESQSDDEEGEYDQSSAKTPPSDK